jgi:hypothetical protein
MPVDYDRDPPDWKAISKRIRDRSGGQCECMGECGLHKTNPGPRRCCERNGQPAKWAKGKIVLTVAHLGVPKADGTPGDPRDKMDVRDENLKALCQRCHLRYDIKEHMKNSAKTREAKKNKNHLLLPL